MSECDTRELARDLLLDALTDLYQESPSLVGADDISMLQGRALRANERAVAARLAIHMDRALSRRGELALHVDVEYSRVLQGVAPKLGPSGRIYPDLIVHHRGCTSCNVLAVELKPGLPKNKTLVNATDARKMRRLTSENWMPGQTAYASGVCVQLAHSGGRLHWYQNGELAGREDWPKR